MKRLLDRLYLLLHIKSIKKGIWMAGNYLGEKVIGRFEKNPLVIVHIDGGLGSQIVRASLGKRFEDRGCEVRYDLHFYTEDGMDNEQIESREYELDKCFPDVELKIATDRELKHYRMLYDYESDLHGKIETVESWDLKKPIYLSYFKSDHLLDWEMVTDYFNIDEIRSILGPYAQTIYEGMKKNNSNGIVNVGVHVRRGDMALTNKEGRYWKVLKGTYFIEAIKRIEAEYSGRQTCYYFFSNGFDFVNKEIISLLGDINYIPVDGCDKDYEDFYLYCKCDAQVKSQGGWGMMAYYFNNSPDKRLVTYDWGKDKKESIYVELEEDMYE